MKLFPFKCKYFLLFGSIILKDLCPPPCVKNVQDLFVIVFWYGKKISDPDTGSQPYNYNHQFLYPQDENI